MDTKTVFVAEAQTNFDPQEVLGVYAKAESAKQACQDRYESYEKTNSVLEWRTSQDGNLRYWRASSKGDRVEYRVDEYAIEN